ncbi:MAG TPA: hypothetical protein VGG82_10180 [Casimicrobiaceae bacterium]|jgi:hypothetical protein
MQQHFAINVEGCDGCDPQQAKAQEADADRAEIQKQVENQRYFERIFMEEPNYESSFE